MKYLRQLLLLQLSLFFCFVSLALGQNKESANSCDCFGALELKDTLTKEIKINGGKGYINDFVNFPRDFPIPDHNIVWLRYTAPYKGKFYLDLRYDKEHQVKFMAFTPEKLNFCSTLKDQYVQPHVINTQFSNGKSGLSEKAGRGYGTPINVEKNDLIYMAINTDEPDVIIQLNPKFKPAKGVEVEKKQHKIYDLAEDPEKSNCIVKLVDANTHEPVYANVTFKGNKLSPYAFLGSYFKFDIERTGILKMDVSSKGYFFKSKSFKIESDKNQELTIEMEPLKVGKKLKLENLQFSMASDRLLPTAFSTLKRLFDFLKLNSKIRIEIQGHVNGPGMENSGKMQRLSRRRARAVYQHLKDNGVDRGRMEYEGYGNTQMLYEDPQNVEEEERNRRVEIVIIE